MNLQRNWKLSHVTKIFLKNGRKYSTTKRGMELAEIVERLEKHAPLSLAEKWDNVGLLVEPSNSSHMVNRILLTNDVTEVIIDDALDKKIDMILSYHPPIFNPLKRLTRASWKERIVVKAIENKIAIYSPHTVFDVMRDGVNDWLASGLGKGSVKPLKCLTIDDSTAINNVIFFLPNKKFCICLFAYILYGTFLL